MNRNQLAALLTTAAALVLSACGGVEQAGGGNTPTNARPGNNRAAGATENASTADVAAATSGGAAANNDEGKGARRANVPQPQIGSGGNDFAIFTQVRGALSNDAELKAADLVVEVKKGAVTLSGTVAGEAQRAKAERVAQAVGGVTSVKNQLKVAAGN